MKASSQTLPQIDAQFEHDPSPKKANELLDKLLTYYTLDQIALHSGICRRSLSYMRHRGMLVYPHQLTLEVLAGEKQLLTDG